MTTKWTYVDFLMYIVPGAFVVSSLLVCLLCLEPQPIGAATGNITAALLLAILTFVAGALVQAISHSSPEKRLKKEHWAGYYPSSLMFFKNNKVVSEMSRDAFLQALTKLKLIEGEDRDSFVNTELPDDPDSSEGREHLALISKANHVFDAARVWLQMEGLAGRIRVSEGFFLMFRGLFVGAFWSFVFFVVVLIVNGLRAIEISSLSFLGNYSTNFLGFFIPAVGVVVSLVCWRVFRARCKGIAQGFAREVQRAICAASTKHDLELEKIAKGATDVEHDNG